VNGDSINAGPIFNCYCSGTTSGYPSGTQSTIILPLPQSDSIYYLFHKRVILITNPLNILTLELLYSVVDMSANNGGGQVMFSPDGSRYIRFNPHNKIRMFDFDRTTGLLSNYENIDVDFGNESPFDGGLLISPSGQYLYVSVKRYLYQMDLFSDDVESSQTLVGEYDGYADPLAANFGRGIMGPDCKLYIFPGNDNRVLHVIHNPNAPGLNCNFEQHALNTLTHHGSTFPNFRLGALGEPISPCAGYTVNSTEAPVFNAVLPLLSVFPNPASEYVRVLPNRPLPDGAVLSLYDGLGRRVRTVLPGGANEAVEVSMSGLPSGRYVWELRAGDGRRLGSGKVVLR